MNSQLDNDFGLLYARPSFLAGFISILDWTGILNIYNDSPDAATADAVAIRSDWDFVGRDIRSAIHEFQETANA